jgi:hypothetical protein
MDCRVNQVIRAMFVIFDLVLRDSYKGMPYGGNRLRPHLGRGILPGKGRIIMDEL